MASANKLQLLDEQGWRHGFANLFRYENRNWWQARRWWIQSLTWLIIINGILAIGLWVIPVVVPQEAGDLVVNLDIFLQLMIWLPMFAVIIITQGAIIAEKQSGTAAWILSAPVSRSGFILSKFFANALGFLFTIVIFQGLIAYIQISLYEGSLIPPGPFLAYLGLLSLYYIFYLALTLMLGTFFDSRGPVLGIALGFAIFSMLNLGQVIFSNFIPQIVLVLPEALPTLVTALLRGQSIPAIWPVPIIVISFYIVLFVALATWRFNREEF